MTAAVESYNYYYYFFFEGADEHFETAAEEGGICFKKSTSFKPVLNQFLSGLTSL